MIRQLKYEDLRDVYSIIGSVDALDHYPRNYYGFEESWSNNVDDAVVGISDGKIIGCGYIINLTEGYHAQVHVFRDRSWKGDFLPYMKAGINFFFGNHDIRKLVCLTDSDSIMRVWRITGINIYTPKLRSFIEKDGEWLDYWCGDILRSDKWLLEQ